MSLPVHSGPWSDLVCHQETLMAKLDEIRRKLTITRPLVTSFVGEVSSMNTVVDILGMG